MSPYGKSTKSTHKPNHRTPVSMLVIALLGLVGIGGLFLSRHGILDKYFDISGIGESEPIYTLTGFIVETGAEEFVLMTMPPNQNGKVDPNLRLHWKVSYDNTTDIRSSSGGSASASELVLGAHVTVVSRQELTAQLENDTKLVTAAQIEVLSIPE